MEEVAFSLYLDWWMGPTKMEGHFQFYAVKADLRSLGR